MGTAVKGVASTAVIRHLEVSNSRPTPLTIHSITSSDPEFSVTSNSCTPVTDCSTGLATYCTAGTVLNPQSAGGSCTPACTMCVTFSPTAAGKRTTKISVTDSDATSPQTATVTGLGSFVELSPIPLRFLGTALGSASTLPLTLTNTGKKVVTIQSISTTGDYTATSACGASVAPQTSCTINVTFTPSVSGSRPGALTVTSSDPAGPERVNLVAAGRGVLLSTTSLTFSPQTVGTTSAPQTVTITNTNVSSILMGDISATDDFVVSSNTCPATLGSKKSCTVQIEFAPDETGAITGTAYISDEDPSSPQRVNLSGTGQ